MNRNRSSNRGEVVLTDFGPQTVETLNAQLDPELGLELKDEDNELDQLQCFMDFKR